MTDKKKGRPRTKSPKVPKTRGAYGPRPETWITGPDEYKHSMYTPWQRMKAQAAFREEPWDLSFEDFYNAWKDCWHKRGRGPDDLCMTRIDYDGVWDKDNIEIIDRTQHCQKQKEFKSRMRDIGIHKKPGRKGLAKRSGVNCKQSVSKLRSIAAHSTGERQRMAHWCANMKSGKKK